MDLRVDRQAFETAKAQAQPFRQVRLRSRPPPSVSPESLTRAKHLTVQGSGSVALARQTSLSERLSCAAGSAEAPAEDEWAEVLIAIMNPETIAKLYNMPGADDIPTEMIERFAAGVRRTDFRQHLLALLSSGDRTAAEAKQKLEDPAFLRSIAPDVLQGLQKALESGSEASASSASLPFPSDPLRSAVEEVLRDDALRDELLKLMPSHMQDPDILRSCMQTPQDCGKMQQLLQMERSGMGPALQQKLFGANAESSASTSTSGKASTESKAADEGVADRLLDELMNSDELWAGLSPMLPKEWVPDRETFRELIKDPIFRSQLVAMLENDPTLANFMKGYTIAKLTNSMKSDMMEGRPGLAELASRIQGNSRLSSLLQQKNVQYAFARLATDPSTIEDYKSDKEVMQAVNGLLSLFNVTDS